MKGKKSTVPCTKANNRPSAHYSAVEKTSVPSLNGLSSKDDDTTDRPTS